MAQAPKKAAPAAASVEDNRASASTARVESQDQRAIEEATAPPPKELRTAEGGKGAGPKSALKGGVGSKGEGPTGGVEGSKNLRYSVQIHTDEKGLEVIEPIDAGSGDEAAQKALAQKNYKGASVRGVTPYSDPDPNSLGGERDAAIMIQNAQNKGAIINTLGTEANAKAVEELGKADVKELGE
jgi:hypothetical protein